MRSPQLSIMMLQAFPKSCPLTFQSITPSILKQINHSTISIIIKKTWRLILCDSALFLHECFQLQRPHCYQLRLSPFIPFSENTKT